MRGYHGNHCGGPGESLYGHHARSGNWGNIYNNADGYRWYHHGIRAGVILDIKSGSGWSRVHRNSGQCSGNRGGSYPQDGWWKKYTWRLADRYPINHGGTFVRYRY